MSSPPTNTRRRWPKVVGLQIAALCAGLLLVEVGWRVVLRFKGTPHDSERAHAEIERLWSSARDFVPRVGAGVDEGGEENPALGRVIHPFQAWENVGGYSQIDVESQRIDQREFDDDIEVLTVGGSVADMFGHFGIPRLAERLKADPRFAGKRFYFYGYARGGFKEPQQLAIVAWMLGQGYTPEVVLNIDGFNDVALSMDNAARGTSPLYPSIPHWGNLAMGGLADRQAIDHATNGRSSQRQIESLSKRSLGAHVEWSALATTLVQRRLNALAKEARTEFDAYTGRLRELSSSIALKGPPFVNDPAEIVNMAVRMWAESSRNLRAICDARGIFYLHVLQPTLHDEGSKPLSSAEIQTGAAPDTWVRGVRLGYPKLREAGGLLAAGGERFLDASGVFRGVERPLYIDNCHFREDGNRVLADAIADEFLRLWPTR